MKQVEGCQYLTYNDCELFEKLKKRVEKKVEYKAVVDNDIIWVVHIVTDKDIGSFDSYGEDFIIAMFEYMQMNAKHC